MTQSTDFDICVIGSGPAGLAAAEAAARAGASVCVFEAKPSLGRKFLMAGKSGLNLTMNLPADAFAEGYGKGPLTDLISLDPNRITRWAEGLGQALFTGSSGRVFPKAMKASPLLRAWLRQLGELGVEMRTRHRWTGWQDGALTFEIPQGDVLVQAKAVVLAMGGASWSRLGSDGVWTQYFDPAQIAPFRPSNMGFSCNWSSYMEPHFGKPLKPVRLMVGEQSVQGECVISRNGVEGSGIYTVSQTLRDALEAGADTLFIDLVPAMTLEDVQTRLTKPRGKTSLSNHLRKAVRLDPVKRAVLMEAGPLPRDMDALAARLKAVPIPVTGPRPLDEAISTDGGLLFEALDADLMVRDRAGLFCAGEMLNWDAPTGGYLITACLATGWKAGEAAARFINR